MNNSVATWYDYQPGQEEVPEHVTHLRIGVQQALAAARNGAAPEIIDLPNGLCYEHPNLQQVQIHIHSTQISGRTSFYYCRSLQQVKFVVTTGQSSIATVESNPSIQSTSPIALETSLTHIGDSAFQDCPKLTTLDLSCLTRLQFLGAYALCNCESLTVVDLSNCALLEEIGASTFWNCKALKIIRLPPNLERIRVYAFQECSAVANIVIPATVGTMGRQAFLGCDSLTQVTFQSTRHLRRLMNDEQFRNTDLHTLELRGPTIPCQLWPLLMEQFLQEGNGILAQARIHKKQRITIAWNFLRANIANFYIDEKKPAYWRKRGNPDNGKDSSS